jgi:hypothetical protein
MDADFLQSRQEARVVATSNDQNLWMSRGGAA